MVAFPHPRPDQAIARLADRQHGVAAVWQLESLGLSPAATRARAASGRLHRIHRGVYAAGTRTLTRRGRWMAAALAHGPEAALSHAAQLALWELRPLRAGPTDITVPARGRRSSAQIQVHNVRHLDPRDRTARDGIPCTTVARTLLDVAETSPARELRLALQAADRRELLDVGELEATIARNPGRRGIPPLRAAIADLIGPAPWTRSELEREFLALVHEAGLPEPQCNVLVDGDLVDAFWPGARLVIELDGYGFHRGRSQFELDRRRDARRLLAGLRTLRLTQRRISAQRAAVSAELRALVRAAA